MTGRPSSVKTQSDVPGGLVVKLSDTVALKESALVKTLILLSRV